ERMIYGSNRFNAMIVIDDLDEELEPVLISRFKFPVEILTFQRFVGPQGERVFRFDPFVVDVTTDGASTMPAMASAVVDPAEVDTIVVPARDEGFNEVVLG